jgi:hypothetical protein
MGHVVLCSPAGEQQLSKILPEYLGSPRPIIESDHNETSKALEREIVMKLRNAKPRLARKLPPINSIHFIELQPLVLAPCPFSRPPVHAHKMSAARSVFALARRVPLRIKPIASRRFATVTPRCTFST